MRKRNLLVFAVLTAAMLVAATAFAGAPVDRATGGGQIVAGTDGTAGSTIAFTARGTVDDATGQVQIVDRRPGKGQDQVKFHGIVDCLRVDGMFAEIGGVEKGGTERFTIFLNDTDQGGPQNGTEMIAFMTMNGDPECGEGEPGDAEMELARGNAQVYDAE